MANKSKNEGKASSKKQRPPQRQSRQPGDQHKMSPVPPALPDGYRGSGKLKGKAALITGGDSGIGRSVAVAFAREGADVAIAYLDEKIDARETRRLIEAEGRRCLTFMGDIGSRGFCQDTVARTARKFGRLDVLVNNAAEQHPTESITDISEDQLLRTFRTNIFSFFFLTAAALPHLKEARGSIINTTSVTAYRGSPKLLDYSSTKGAIVSFTRSLSGSLARDDIRVNAIAPGPIWTPLIPATFPPDKVASFGSDTPMGRAGDPHELAAAYVFLACNDSSYVTGQTLHINGGEIVNG